MVQISINGTLYEICIPVWRRFQTTSKSTFGRSPPNVNIPPTPFRVFAAPAASSPIRPSHDGTPAPTDRSSLLTTKTQVAEAPCARGISALNALYVGQEL